jgi:hypothetical protein
MSKPRAIATRTCFSCLSIGSSDHQSPPSADAACRGEPIGSFWWGVLARCASWGRSTAVADASRRWPPDPQAHAPTSPTRHCARASLRTHTSSTSAGSSISSRAPLRPLLADALAPAPGEEQLATLLQESLNMGHRHKRGAVRAKDLERAAVDTTVQEKALPHSRQVASYGGANRCDHLNSHVRYMTIPRTSSMTGCDRPHRVDGPIEMAQAQLLSALDVLIPHPLTQSRSEPETNSRCDEADTHGSTSRRR